MRNFRGVSVVFVVAILRVLMMRVLGMLALLLRMDVRAILGLVRFERAFIQRV